MTLKVKNIGRITDYVYDLSLDGTIINAVGLNVISNTDGFNFQLPDHYRYTEENPYIDKGNNREVEKGKAYTGYEADVAEFNDLYMDKIYSENGVQKMGLGIDEIVSSTINFSRKNYADYFPENKYPDDVKMVGNTIKSKKMPEYIAKFLAKGIRMLLRGEGHDFLDEYYQYIDDIYNYRIPLKDIASKGKIKKSVEQYKRDVKEITKAGRPKSRQAWYELVIQNKVKVDNGDTIYYVNTGKSKSHSDVKKVTHIFSINDDGEKVEITKEIERLYKKYKTDCKENNISDVLQKNDWIKATYKKVKREEEITLNCAMLPLEIVESEKDVLCSEVDIEYNVPKYIAQFNSRITPLLVCFSRDIRDKILVTNPDNNPYFTDAECQLVAGEPNKPSDQDTYDDFMTMEDKEIRFWMKYDLIPPFLKECGMGEWEDIVADYNRRMQEERINGIAKEKELFNEVLNKLSVESLNGIIEESVVPQELLKIVNVDLETMQFTSKTHEDAIIATINDIYDCVKQKEIVYETED